MSPSFISNYVDTDNRYKQEVENIIPSVVVSVNRAGRYMNHDNAPLSVRE
jgi:hypothetical protein